MPDPVPDERLMDPLRRELELPGNLCLRELRLSVPSPDGLELQRVSDLPPANGGWRLPDLAWGAEAWAVLRLQVPVVALPPTDQVLSLRRVKVEGRGVSRASS